MDRRKSCSITQYSTFSAPSSVSTGNLRHSRQRRVFDTTRKKANFTLISCLRGIIFFFRRVNTAREEEGNKLISPLGHVVRRIYYRSVLPSRVVEPDEAGPENAARKCVLRPSDTTKIPSNRYRVLPRLFLRVSTTHLRNARTLSMLDSGS